MREAANKLLASRIWVPIWNAATDSIGTANYGPRNQMCKRGEFIIPTS